MDSDFNDLDKDIGMMVTENTKNLSHDTFSPEAKKSNLTPTSHQDDSKSTSISAADGKVVPMVDRYPSSSSSVKESDINHNGAVELLHSGPLLGDLPSLSGTPGGGKTGYHSP